MSHIINKDTCIGCGACAGQCPQSAIVTDDDKYKIVKGKCTDCGACVDVCPVNAISKE
jgi:ferredoxin